MNDRLTSTHPEFAGTLQSSSEITRQRVGDEVVRFLYAQFPWLASELDATAADKLSTAASALSERSDALYFTLQDEGNAAHLATFRLARAAAAMACIARGELSDAIYEGLHAFESDKPLLDQLSACLHADA